MVVFIGSYEGKSEKTGNEYQRVTLMEIRRSKKEDKAIIAKQVDFFVDKLDCSALVCGDVVKPEFEEPEILGGKLELVSLEVVGDNIFEELV